MILSRGNNKYYFIINISYGERETGALIPFPIFFHHFIPFLAHNP